MFNPFDRRQEDDSVLQLSYCRLGGTSGLSYRAHEKVPLIATGL